MTRARTWGVQGTSPWRRGSGLPLTAGGLGGREAPWCVGSVPRAEGTGARRSQAGCVQRPVPARGGRLRGRWGGRPGAGRGYDAHAPGAGRGRRGGPSPLPRSMLSVAGGEPQTKSRGRSRAGTGARRGGPGAGTRRGEPGGGGQRHRGAETGSRERRLHSPEQRAPARPGSGCRERAVAWGCGATSPGGRSRSPERHAPPGARLRLVDSPAPLQLVRGSAPGEPVSTGLGQRPHHVRGTG